MKQNNDDVKLLFWAGDHACIKREDNTFDSINAEDVDRINAALASIPAPALIEDNMEVYEAGWDDAMLAMKSTQPAPANGVGEDDVFPVICEALSGMYKNTVPEDWQAEAMTIYRALAKSGALRQGIPKNNNNDNQASALVSNVDNMGTDQPQTVSAEELEELLNYTVINYAAKHGVTEGCVDVALHKEHAKAIAKAFPNGVKVE